MKGGNMADKSRITGVKDKHYDLISVLYHTLQGAEEIAAYVRDAEQDGDQKVAEYFRSVQEQYRQIAQEGKHLLVQRLNGDSN
jgi:hypothetical protein